MLLLKLGGIPEFLVIHVFNRYRYTIIGSMPSINAIISSSLYLNNKKSSQKKNKRVCMCNCNHVWYRSDLETINMVKE